MSDWLLRPPTDDDRGTLLYMLGVSYCRSKAGQRAGASRAGGSLPDPRVSREEAKAKERAFLAAHRPVWDWLLECADIMLACDPEQPGIIWGYIVTSGDDVVHAVGCKRSFCEQEPGVPPLSIEIVSALLGDRLHKHQVCTLELPQMRTKVKGCIGMDRPQKWSLDPTWLVSRMVGVRQAA